MKILACLPVLLLAAAPAQGQPIVSTAPHGEIGSITVDFSDLNIHSKEGLARLDDRLRAAARMVCDVRPEPQPLIREVAINRCFRSALANARETGRELIAARRSDTLLAAAIVIPVRKP